LNYM